MQNKKKRKNHTGKSLSFCLYIEMYAWCVFGVCQTVVIPVVVVVVTVIVPLKCTTTFYIIYNKRISKKQNLLTNHKAIKLN